MAIDWTEILKTALESDNRGSLFLVLFFLIIFTAMQLYFRKSLIRELLSESHLVAKLIGMGIGLFLLIAGSIIIESVLAFAIAAIASVPVLIISFLFIIFQDQEFREDIVDSIGP